MDNVKKYDLKVCPDCFGRGEIYVTGPSGNNPLVSLCATCKGNRYVPAPAPEDKPAGAAILDEPLTASEHRFAALIAENEAYGRKLAAMESELAAARAEVERLRAGIDQLAKQADYCGNHTEQTPDWRINWLHLAKFARALLSSKEDD